MTKQAKRPLGLTVIIIYKLLTAIILAIAALALLLTVKNYQVFVEVAQTYTLEGKVRLIRWLLAKLLQINPKTLQFTGIATCIYSIVTVIKNLGLWYQKAWAKFLFVALVAISIPPEFELLAGFNLLKLVIFIINLAVLWYLLRHL